MKKNIAIGAVVALTAVLIYWFYSTNVEETKYAKISSKFSLISSFDKKYPKEASMDSMFSMYSTYIEPNRKRQQIDSLKVGSYFPSKKQFGRGYVASSKVLIYQLRDTVSEEDCKTFFEKNGLLNFSDEDYSLTWYYYRNYFPRDGRVLNFFYKEASPYIQHTATTDPWIAWYMTVRKTVFYQYFTVDQSTMQRGDYVIVQK